MKKASWEPLSFYDNLDKAALHVGYANLPLAWGIAKVNWPSVEARDGFLQALINVNNGGAQ